MTRRLLMSGHDRGPTRPRRSRAWRVVAALGALAVLAVHGPAGLAQSPQVVAPAGWVSGDPHVHVQLCDEPVELTPADVYAELAAQHLSVACVQLWAKWMLDPTVFLSQYAPLVTGLEHPVSAGDPDAIVQFGVEVSGFPASQFGHLQALGIDDGAFPTGALHSGPILAFFRQQPGAVTGYAHVLWFDDHTPATFLPGVGAPYLAPVDAALGEIDFVEARLTAQPGPLSWRGLAYKLFGAGLRVAVAGGSDNSCLTDEIGGTRTWVRLDGAPLTFGAWTEGLAAGATSLADGPSVFLDSTVDGTSIGGEHHLGAPGDVLVHVELHVAAGVAAAGELHVLKDGAVVASAPYDLTSGGVASVDVPVHCAESAWLAASADVGAHTGATFVVVGDRPVVRAEDAGYMRAYCDDLLAGLAVFGVPSVQAQIAQRVGSARKVYAALEARALPLPDGVLRFGTSTPACRGPIAAGVDAPPANDFRLTCINAPPNTAGLLVLGLADDPVGLQIMGMSLHVALTAPYITLPVQTNGGGYAEAPIHLPSGVTFTGQFVWANTPSCGNGGLVSASDALRIVVP